MFFYQIRTEQERILNVLLTEYLKASAATSVHWRSLFDRFWKDILSYIYICIFIHTSIYSLATQTPQFHCHTNTRPCVWMRLDNVCACACSIRTWSDLFDDIRSYHTHYTHNRINVDMSMLNVHMHLDGYVRINMYTHWYMSMYTYVAIYIYIYAYTHIYIWFRVQLITKRTALALRRGLREYSSFAQQWFAVKLY